MRLLIVLITLYALTVEASNEVNLKSVEWELKGHNDKNAVQLLNEIIALNNSESEKAKVMRFEILARNKNLPETIDVLEAKNGIEEIASGGNAYAQFVLAKWYKRGYKKKVKKDNDLYNFWLEKSLNQKSFDALGHVFYNQHKKGKYSVDKKIVEELKAHLESENKKKAANILGYHYFETRKYELAQKYYIEAENYERARQLLDKQTDRFKTTEQAQELLRLAKLSVEHFKKNNPKTPGAYKRFLDDRLYAVESAKKDLYCSYQENTKTKLFGEPLNCTHLAYLPRAIKQAGAKPIREDSKYYAYIYDSSSILKGSSELSVYFVKNEFAEAKYSFPSNGDLKQVETVRNFISDKYGNPTLSKGSINLGVVNYTWQLSDGIEILVTRKWPKPDVTLSFIHPDNLREMNNQIAESKRKLKAAEYESQSNAF